MSDVTIRRVREGEQLPYLRFVMRGFHEWYPDDVLRTSLPIMGESLYDVAVAGDEMVGSIGAMHTSMSVPGGEVGVAAVTAVTVRTDHRRQGLLTAMMGRVLDEAIEAGLPMAALYASEGGIYGRFGFGPAVPMTSLEVTRARSTPAVPTDPGRVRVVTAEVARARLPGVLDQVRRQRGGLLALTDHWWDLLTVVDREEERDGWTPRHFAAIDDLGVVAYRTRDNGGEDGAGRLKVERLFGVDGQVVADLWAFVSSVDLVGTIEVPGRPADDPLLHVLPDEVRARVSKWDTLWTRLLDVPAAMAARTAGSDGSVIVEVTDALVPANAGRWRLQGEGTVACEATTDAPDLALDVAALSSVHLGGVRTTSLVDAGRVVELQEGAAARLDRLLAVDRAPWAPFHF